MGLKKFRPTTPNLRFTRGAGFDEITKSKPEKALLTVHSSTGGRNAQGRVSIRHRGGGHKRHLRQIDFKREKIGIPAKVEAISALWRAKCGPVETLMQDGSGSGSGSAFPATTGSVMLPGGNQRGQPWCPPPSLERVA